MQRMALRAWERDWPRVRRARRALTSASDEAVQTTLAYLFFHCKRGVYVLGDETGLRLVVIVDNERYENGWPAVRTATGEDASAFCRRLGCDARPVATWALNGRLVDNWRSGAPWSGGPCLPDALEAVGAAMALGDGVRECVVNCRDAPLLHVRLDAGDALRDACVAGARWLRHSAATRCGDVAAARFLRVLSQYATPAHADEPIPLLRSWAQDRAPRAYDAAPRPWRERRACAVFRGSATTHVGGECQRVRVAQRLLQRAGRRRAHGRRRPLPPRPRRAPSRPPAVPSALRRPPLTLEQQHGAYRWALYIAGNSGADRLMELLRARFTVVVVASDAPEPALLLRGELDGRHAVHTTEAELPATLAWCAAHDDECRAIAERGRRLWEATRAARPRRAPSRALWRPAAAAARRAARRAARQRARRSARTRPAAAGRRRAGRRAGQARTRRLTFSGGGLARARGARRAPRPAARAAGAERALNGRGNGDRGRHYIGRGSRARRGLRRSARAPAPPLAQARVGGRRRASAQAPSRGLEDRLGRQRVGGRGRRVRRQRVGRQ